MPTRTHHYAQVSLLWLLLISSEAYHPDLGDMLLISYIDQCFVCDSQIFFTTAFCTKQYINSATFRRKNSPLNGYFSCLNHLTPMQRHFIRLGTESWSDVQRSLPRKVGRFWMLGYMLRQSHLWYSQCPLFFLALCIHLHCPCIS